MMHLHSISSHILKKKNINIQYADFNILNFARCVAAYITLYQMETEVERKRTIAR